MGILHTSTLINKYSGPEFKIGSSDHYLNEYFYSQLGIDTSSSSIDYYRSDSLRKIISESTIKLGYYPDQNILNCTQEYYIIKNGVWELKNTATISVNTRLLPHEANWQSNTLQLQINVVGNTGYSEILDPVYASIYKKKYRAHIYATRYASSGYTRKGDYILKIVFGDGIRELSKKISEYRYIKISMILGDIYYIKGTNYYNSGSYSDAFHIQPAIIAYNESSFANQTVDIPVYEIGSALSVRRTQKPFEFILDISKLNESTDEKYYSLLLYAKTSRAVSGRHAVDVFIKDIVFLK